jgi:hypothetical protein
MKGRTERGPAVKISRKENYIMAITDGEIRDLVSPLFSEKTLG